MKNLNQWKREVKEIQSYLDESYTVDTWDIATSASLSKKIRLPWGKLVIERFVDRIIPQIGGGLSVKRAASVIEEWIEQAVSFGNASLIVSSSGGLRIPSPLHSFSQRVDGENSFYEEMPEGFLLGQGSTLYYSAEAPGASNFAPVEVEDAEIFTIFYEAKNTMPYGSSRLSPSIREQIHFASRIQLYIHSVSHDQGFTQLVLTNLAQDAMTAYQTRGAGGDASGVAELQMGVRKALMLAQNGDGSNVGVESIAPTDPSGLVKVFERAAANVASARGLEPRELGNTASVAPSAEAQYAAKDSLVVEIRKFERAIHGEILSALHSIAFANGEQDPTLSWANPATPSESTMMDAFIKLVSALPSARYSRRAMLAHGFEPELVEELLGGSFDLLEASEVDEDELTS